MGVIKLFIFLLIILAYINTLIRSDFINIIVPVYMLIVYSTTLHIDVVSKLNFFLILVGLCLGYDALWFIFCSSVNILNNC
jgi:hypothetical protein